MSDLADKIKMPVTPKQEWEEFPLEGDFSDWMIGSETITSVEAPVVQENDDTDSLTATGEAIVGTTNVSFDLTGGKSGKEYIVEQRFTTSTGRKLAGDFPIKVFG